MTDTTSTCRDSNEESDFSHFTSGSSDTRVTRPTIFDKLKALKASELSRKRKVHCKTEDYVECVVMLQYNNR